MKTHIALITGAGLFFLFTGFNKRPLLQENLFHDTLTIWNGKPLLQLNFIPDVRVQLATGEYVQLPKLVDQKRYIFINVWSGKKRIDKYDLQLVDSIAETYKNKLTVIGLLDEGNLIQLNKLVKKYQLKNMQGLVSTDIKKYLKMNRYPYGILFSKTGKLIEAGMNGDALGVYMEKHVSVSRAKF